MKKYIITICIIVALVIICIAGYFIYQSINSKVDEGTLKAKANQEMQYLNTNIISIMNQFNHISYPNYKIVEAEIKTSEQTGGSESSSQGSKQGSSSSESSGGSQEKSQSEDNTNTTTEISNIIANSILTNNNTAIDWNKIKQEVELLYAKWPSILVDLSSLNVNKDNLLKFTDTLNQTVSALEKKDKKNSLNKLSDLYTLTNLYLKDFSNDQIMINLFSTKAYIARAYALTEDSKWEEMKKDIGSAKTEYAKILNNSLDSKNVNSINKGYILLNEMEKNIDAKDKNVFFINYKNLMQELDTIGK